jgi:hypothetical protein
MAFPFVFQRSGNYLSRNDANGKHGVMALGHVRNV